MNDQTATIGLGENAAPRVAETTQRLAEVIQFAAELELGFSWYHDGPAVLVTTPDEAIGRVMREQGASVRPYPPEAATNPQKTVGD